jgi:DNA polymerase I-like protein with 3'-5' exonuclease and polymerase domains
MCVERPTGYFSPEEEYVLRGMLRKILTDPAIELVGQNYSYDMQYEAKYLLIDPRVDFDTLVMQHLAWPGTPASLAYIASFYNRYYRYWKDDGKDWDEDIPEEQYWTYNCVDGVNTLEASYHLEACLRGLKLYHLLDEQMEVTRLQYEMMMFGIAVNHKVRADMALKLMDEMHNYDEWFQDCISPEARVAIIGKNPKTASTWWSSPAQLGRLFYDELGIDEVKDRKTGARRVDDDALLIIKSREPLLTPLISKLQDYRSTGIFFNNVTSGLESDGRMRTQYTQMPNTFRWASKKNVWKRGMNMQNVPKGDED